MFARSVSIHLKPGFGTKFTQTLEKEVIPMLRKQKGFQDEITLVGPTGKDALAISLWDEKENAEAYNQASYPKVLEALEPVIDGTPQVKTFEVSNSTWYSIAAQQSA